MIASDATRENDRLWLAYMSSGSREDRNALAEVYLPLARSVAHRFLERGSEREDLEQVAYLALLSALERFDPGKGLRFTTFAVPTIAGSIRNHLRDKTFAIRLPRDTASSVKAMLSAQEAFRHRENRTPTAQELASEMQLPVQEVLTAAFAQQALYPTSLDAVFADDEENNLYQYLGTKEAGYDRFEQSEWMQWVLSQATPRECELIKARFEEGLGQRDIAARLGISQMQVSRIERRFLERIRTMQEQE